MKRIMFFLLTVMLCSTIAEAQVTAGRVGDGNITVYGMTYTNVFGLDFDNDGELEFKISDFSGSPTIYNGAFEYDYEDGGSNILADEGQWDYVGVLDAGVTVSSASADLFAGYGDAYFNTENIVTGTRYLGFRIKLSDGVHYGWAEYTMTQEGDDYRATFNSCYYNATVGESIVTGETGGATGCVPQTLTFSENFDALDSDLPDCWGQEAQAAHLAKWGVSSAGYSGKCLVFSDYLNCYSYLTLPTFNLSAANAGARLRLMYKNPATDYLDNTTIKFYYRTDPEAEWTLITGEDITDAHNAWQELTVMLPESGNAPVYQVAIYTIGMNVYARCYTYVDNITLEPAPDCTQPTGLSASDVTATRATIAWTENGSATEWSLKVNDEAWITVNENPYVLTNLTPQTNYNVKVRSICGTTDTSTMANVSFETPCGVESFPYSENFESLSSGLPNCWSQENSSTNSKWNFSSTGNTGNGLVFNDYYGFYSRLIVPVVDCSSQAANAQLSFNYKNPANSGNRNVTLKIYYRTSATDEWTEISDAAITAAASDWTLAEIELPNSAYAPNYQVSILATGVSTYPMLYAYIDDVQIDVQPSCKKPSDFAVTDITSSEATLEWTENGSATAWVIQVNGEEWELVDANPYTLTGLSGSTRYNVKLRAFCGGTDTSSAVSTTFRTECAPITLPYNEDFDAMDASEPPICWATPLTTSSGDYPIINSDAGNPGLGVTCYATGYYSNMLVSPKLPVNANTCNLIFDAMIYNYESAYLEVGVMADPNNVSTFTRIDSIGGLSNGNTWKTYEIDLTLINEIASSVAQYVAFKFVGSYDYCRIDNVLIEQASSCKKPSNLVVEATESSMTIGWTENGSASAWLVKIGDGEWEQTTSNPFVKYGLDANTNYSVSVRAFCGGSDTSNTLTGTFHTECAAEGLPYSESFESYAYGDFPDCWKKLSVECSVESSSLYASNGANALRIRSGAMIVTPVINVEGNDVNIGFDLQRTAASAGKLAVGVAASQALTENAVYMDTIEPSATYTYDRYQYLYHNTQNLQSICLVFKQIGNTVNYEYFYMDSLVVSEPSSCPKPTNLTATATATSLTLSWNENGGSSQWLLKINDGAYQTITTNPYTITGLNMSTTYTVEIRAFCGVGDTSAALIGTFTTEAGGQTSDCITPTNITVTPYDQYAVVSWSGTAAEYQIMVTGVAQPITQIVSSSPYSIEDLEPNSAYSISIRAICGVNDTSEWSSPIAFHTSTEGIGDIRGDLNLNIYPNPTSGSAIIALDGVTGSIRVDVVDISGRIVSSETIECNDGCSQQLNVSNLAHGSYFVRITGQAVNIVKKLFIR